MGGKQTKEYFDKYAKSKKGKEAKKRWLEKNRPKVGLINCTIFLWGW